MRAGRDTLRVAFGHLRSAMDEVVPPGRPCSTAITKLDECEMWCERALSEFDARLRSEEDTAVVEVSSG